MRLWDRLQVVHEDFRQSGMSGAELDAVMEGTLAEVRKERRHRTGQNGMTDRAVFDCMVYLQAVALRPRRS